jgi:zinc transporter ZupT
MRESVMTGTITVLSAVLGAFTAYASERFPLRREALETAAGFMLIGGFAAIGCALPMI